MGGAFFMRLKKIIIVIILGAGIVFLGILTVNNAVSPIVPKFNYISAKFSFKPYEIHVEKNNYQVVYGLGVAKDRVLKIVSSIEDYYYFGKGKIVKLLN